LHPKGLQSGGDVSSGIDSCVDNRAINSRVGTYFITPEGNIGLNVTPDCANAISL